MEEVNNKGGVKFLTQVTLLYSNEDTYINSYRPNTNFDNNIFNCIGRKNCKTSYRTLLKFDICSIPKDAIITRAILKLYVDYAHDSSVIGKFTPYAITSLWNERTVTWNNCPSFDPFLLGSTTSIGGVGWYEWDITNVMNAWFNKTHNNYGIVLKDNSKFDLSDKRLIGRKSIKCKQTSPFSPVISVYYDLPKPSYNKVTLIGRKFIDKSIFVKTSDDFLPTATFNTSEQSQVTFFIINTGQNPASIMLEISPNDIDYAVDNTVFEVLPGKTIAIVPRIFAKYTRLIYQSKNPLHRTSLNIIFQSCI